MASWKPIELSELEELVEEELAMCTLAQRTVFEQHRVPFYQVPIHRLGDLECVFVVAVFPIGILYYEDVEEGFELDRLGPDGAIPVQGCNQLSLNHVLSYVQGGPPPLVRGRAQPLT